jgi:hypothetical protein
MPLLASRRLCSLFQFDTAHLFSRLLQCFSFAPEATHRAAARLSMELARHVEMPNGFSDVIPFSLAHVAPASPRASGRYAL